MYIQTSEKHTPFYSVILLLEIMGKLFYLKRQKFFYMYKIKGRKLGT